ncbi:MAG TPA: hypothetical protein VL200_17710 [Lacunisphaera sp.]|nr:hypothetical protein [Lacunisphaera sp.]
MTETASAPAKAPWHLWVVGGLSLLWNAMGALDFTMTETHNEAYLKQFTPEQLAYFTGFPAWVIVAWGLATWGSLAGSLLLLLRRAVALHVFVTSFAAMILTFVHNFILSDGLKLMGGPGALVFTAIIVVVGVALVFYARALRRRGVLR